MQDFNTQAFMQYTGFFHNNELIMIVADDCENMQWFLDSERCPEWITAAIEQVRFNY